MLGANFLQFRNWLFATKDKWLLSGQVSKTMGQFIPMKDEFGKTLYVQNDGSLSTESGNGQ
jgi:hypothetical protein